MEKRTAQPDPQAGLLQSWRVVNMLWLIAFGLAVAAWVILPLVVRQSAAEGGRTVAMVFYAVGFAEIGVGWWVKERGAAANRKAGARSIREALGRIVGPSLVAVTVAETPAILGVVLYLAFGNRTGLAVLCGLSLIGLALFRPRLEQWQEVLRATRIDANRSS